jgi:hypothetical protein
MLKIAPSNYVRQKKWSQKPWVEEVRDLKFRFTYKPSKTPKLGKDGDEEIMREVLENELELAKRISYDIPLKYFGRWCIQQESSLDGGLRCYHRNPKYNKAAKYLWRDQWALGKNKYNPTVTM